MVWGGDRAMAPLAGIHTHSGNGRLMAWGGDRAMAPPAHAHTVAVQGRLLLLVLPPRLQGYKAAARQHIVCRGTANEQADQATPLTPPGSSLLTTWGRKSRAGPCTHAPMSDKGLPHQRPLQQMLEPSTRPH